MMRKPRNLDMTREALAAVVNYNPETGEFTHVKGRNQFSRPGTVAGGRTEEGYVIVGIHGKHVLGHRLAWFWVHGEWPTMEVDHKNRERTDNRIDNLRLVTHGENRQNMTEYASNTSGHKGVYWCKKMRKWKAQINHDKKRHYLGNFPEFDLAVQAYTEAAARLHRFNTVHATVQ